MPPDDKNSAESVPSVRIEDEMQLQECDAATINELNWKSSSGQVPLPLPEQDREVMEKRIEKNAKRFRISILELLLATTFVCSILALTSWISLPVLTLSLGCTAVVFILGLFDRLFDTRQRLGITWILLISYLAAAAISLIRTI